MEERRIFVIERKEILQRIEIDCVINKFDVVGKFKNETYAESIDIIAFSKEVDRENLNDIFKKLFDKLVK